MYGPNLVGFVKNDLLFIHGVYKYLLNSTRCDNFSYIRDYSLAVGCKGFVAKA